MTSKLPTEAWAVFYLANDTATYGADAGAPIIVTRDDETEICGPVHDASVALLIAQAPRLARLLDAWVDAYGWDELPPSMRLLHEESRKALRNCVSAGPA